MTIKEEKVVGTLKDLIFSVKGMAKEIAVLIVANSKSDVGLISDYLKHSVTTEFFNESEYEEIVSGFRENDIYVEFFRNEMSFIKWVIGGGLETINKRHKIVYNAANSGKGPGKKSLIPSFCNLNNIPFTNSDPYVVSLCRHKYHCTNILASNNIPTPRSWYYHNITGWISTTIPAEGMKLIAKPTYESASVGIDQNSIFEYSESKVKLLDNLSIEFSQPITVQEFIPGFEVEVPVMILDKTPLTIHPIGLMLGETKDLGDKILDYETVYNDMYQFYMFNQLGNEINTNIMLYAEKAIKLIGTEGFGRIDFRVKENGDVYIMDIATYPHLTKHSSFWFLFKNLGFEYKDVFAVVLALAAKKYNWI